MDALEPFEGKRLVRLGLLEVDSELTASERAASVLVDGDLERGDGMSVKSMKQQGEERRQLTS
jgi:hypothetical protein